MDIEDTIILHYSIPESRGGESRYKESVNWGALIRMALFHDVFPSIYKNFENEGWKGVPHNRVKQFHSLWKEHIARHIILVDELKSILGLFEKEGIKTVPLKGYLMGAMCYPDDILRAFKDIDIWVSPQDMPRAKMLLEGEGYVPVPYKSFETEAENKYNTPFYRYLPCNKRICVELHWKLAYFRDYSGVPERKCWKNCQRTLIYGNEFFTLLPEDLFIYLIVKIHATRYIYLKKFVDLYQFLACYESTLDWEYIRGELKEMGMINNFLFALSTMRMLFKESFKGKSQINSVKCTKRAKGSVRVYMFEKLINPVTILHGRYDSDLRHAFSLLLNDNFRDSIASFMRVLFPSRGGIAHRYKILPGSHKVYMYYLFNPIFIIYRLIRGFTVRSWGEINVKAIFLHD
ncbi:MAG: nucleotidyltransferase family protein [bacterium]